MKFKLENIEGSFLGLAIGDALGVPIEFRNRTALKSNPVTTMTGYGMWNQPPGTWSDHSSLTFCLADSLSKGYDLSDIGRQFVQWMINGHWSARGQVFDIGGTTEIALQRIRDGEHPLHSGEFDVDSNGNGSLMRIVPASLYFFRNHNEMLMERMREISGITHGHFRSVFACFVYSKLVAAIFKGFNKDEAYAQAIEDVNSYVTTQKFSAVELQLFGRILDGRLPSIPEEEIFSSGYVLHTLEASVWCFLTGDSFKSTILNAVNLGGDTDTTACVTGALAGLYYEKAEIPPEWIEAIARKNDIINLSKEFQKCLEMMILA